VGIVSSNCIFKVDLFLHVTYFEARDNVKLNKRQFIGYRNIWKKMLLGTEYLLISVRNIRLLNFFKLLT